MKYNPEQVDYTLTDKDKKILEVIKNHEVPIDGILLGIKLGQSYNQASKYCSNSLRKLVETGDIIRVKTDRVRYKLNVNKNSK